MREKASCLKVYTVPFLKEQLVFQSFIFFFSERVTFQTYFFFFLEMIVVSNLVVLSQESVRFFQMIISRSQLL